MAILLNKETMEKEIVIYEKNEGSLGFLRNFLRSVMITLQSL